MATSAPPLEVMFEFVRTVNELVEEWDELLVPVLRGSTLMEYWFGEKARPAADVDFECFQREMPEPHGDEEEEDEEEWRGDGFGRHGEYQSLVDFGKAMCRYAAIGTGAYRWRKNQPAPAISFEETDPPEGGVSLWTYGTPGERYFAGWSWNKSYPQGSFETGQLQIDIAASGYALDEIAIETIELGSGKDTVVCPAYTLETLLAAKLSWLVRSIEMPAKKSQQPLKWKGEPKDLFDVHLLLTEGELQPELVQKSLLAIGAQDQLEWNNLEWIFRLRHSEMTDADFANWPDFFKRHKEIVEAGPAEMLRTIADRLEPLLGDFYRRDEMPFIHTINGDPKNELNYLVYADWLEDNDYADRGEFLRQFAKVEFHANKKQRAALRESFNTVSRPWLYQLFGTTARFTEVRKQMETVKK